MPRRPDGAAARHPATEAALALLGLSLAVTLAAASPAWAQDTARRETGTIVGRVLQQGDAPASGVRVLVLSAGFSETIEEDPRFRIESAAEGIHRVILLHPEFGTDTVRATVAGGMTTGLTLRYGSGGQVSKTLHLGGLPADTSGAAEMAGPNAGRSRIVGRLLDRRSGEPVPSATVSLPGLDRRTRTSTSGGFTLDSLPAGSHTLRVDHVRYGERTTDVEVPGRRTVDVELRLAPRAIEVDPIEVSVDVRAPSLESADYYERRRVARQAGYGHFLEGEELHRRGNRISHVLGTVPRLDIGKFGEAFGGAANVPYFPRYQGFSGTCLPAIYVDGSKMVGSGPAGEVVANLGSRGVDGLVNLASVAAVEVYESPAATAGRFQGSDSRCGVIAIWTKSGGG